MEDKIENRFQIDAVELARQRECNRLENILSLETNRGAAILGTAYLEERLKEILYNYLRDSKVTMNFVGRQRLESLSSLAFSVGLVNEDEYAEIDRLRKIRNLFAHSFNENLSFDDPRIASICGDLQHDDHFWVSGNKVETNREKFTCSIFMIGRCLLFRVRPDERLELLHE